MDSEPLNIPRIIKQLKYLGFGFCYAWGHLMWQTPAPHSIQMSTNGINPIWLLFAMLCPLISICIYMVGKQHEILRYRWLIVVSPISVAFGTALTFLSYAAPLGGLQYFLSCAAGILLAFGSTLLPVLWMTVLSMLKVHHMEVIVPASFVVTLVCAIVFPFATEAIRLVLVCCLPIFAGITLWMSWKEVLQSSNSEDMGQKKPISKLTSSILIRSNMGIALILILSNIIGCFFFILDAEHSSIIQGNVSLSAIFATALSLFVALAISRFSKPVNMGSFYKFLLAPMLLGVGLKGIGGHVLDEIAMADFTYVFIAATVVGTFYAIRSARLSGFTVARTSGWLSICASVGNLIGGIAPYITTGINGQGWLSMPTICFAFVALSAAAILFFPSLDEMAPCLKSNGSQNGKADAAKEEVPHESPSSMIQQRFNLTPRETEIAELLLRGRSQVYIRDLLFISQNTVNSHVKSIYKKLDIHSKQELFDLAESLGAHKDGSSCEKAAHQ